MDFSPRDVTCKARDTTAYGWIDLYGLECLCKANYLMGPYSLPDLDQLFSEIIVVFYSEFFQWALGVFNSKHATG